MEPSKTDVVILCGGLGRRLRPVLSDRPKSLANINNRPFLDILVNYVARYGFHRFVLCAGYKSSPIREYFENREQFRIVFSEEKEPLGTGGALKNCEPYLESDLSLVLNGDSLCLLDLTSLLNFHVKQDGIASVTVVYAEERKDGGFIEIDERNRVISFNEKRYNGRTPYLNAGIYVFDRKVLNFIPPRHACSLENEVFPSLLDSGVYGYVTAEALYDIGTPERLESFRYVYNHYLQGRLRA